jgi:putative PIN family toxin of toxin-antitoxin system
MADLLRVVIDTNLIMSAILSDRGAAAKLINWMTGEEDYFRLLVSPPIWDEYCAVANWLIPENKQEEKRRRLETLQLQAAWIAPTVTLSACKDEADNRFLECAVTARRIILLRKNPPFSLQSV